MSKENKNSSHNIQIFIKYLNTFKLPLKMSSFVITRNILLFIIILLNNLNEIPIL